MKITPNTSEDKIKDLNDEVKRHGDNFTRRITKTIKKESWGWVAIELAWTCIFTVILGLYIAYYIAYDTSPQNNVIFYFASYTTVAVIMAVIVRTIRNAKSTEDNIKKQRNLLRCNNHIFSLMTGSRDSAMSEMESTQRRIYAATIVLKDPQASSDDLAVAIKDLTGSAALAEAIKRIETFRHHGLMARIKDEYDEIKELLNSHSASLYEISPSTAKILTMRFNGKAPTMLQGQERPYGFLERTLNAIENNDLSLMTFDDVHDVFVFSLEMLNDREIPVLHPEFKGHSDYVVIQDKLDRSRSLLRQAVAKRNSRLKVVAEELNSVSQSDVIMPTSFNMEEIIPLIEDHYTELRTLIKIALKDGNKQALRRYHKTLNNTFKLFTKIERHHKRALRFMRAFNNIQKEYDKLWRKHGKSVTLMLEGKKGDANSISIREDYITLDDEQKLSLTKKLILLHQYTLKEQRKTYKKFTSIEFSPLSYKRLAMEYVMIMNEMLNFSQPEEMFAIEYSRAPCFGHIDINDPTRTKIGLALLSIEELQQTRTKVAHRLARNLREYYKVPLNDNTIRYLVKNYGADKEYLANLNKSNLKDKKNVEERYSIDIKITNWAQKFAPLMKKIRAELAKK